jgi:hypothetical protein
MRKSPHIVILILAPEEAGYNVYQRDKKAFQIPPNNDPVKSCRCLWEANNPKQIVQNRKAPLCESFVVKNLWKGMTMALTPR